MSKHKLADNNLPTLMCGGICQNKAWSIDAYLEAILMQDYPKDKISLVFYVNDSTDGTKEKLIAILKEVKKSGEYRRVTVTEVNYGYTDTRKDRSRDMQIMRGDHDPNKAVAFFAHFARVRNEWLKMRQDEEYYFSIDTDVILKQPFAFRQMVECELDILAAPVDNSENRGDDFDKAKELWDKLLKDPNPKNREFASKAMRGEIEGAKFGPDAVWNYGMLRGGNLIRFNKEPGLMEVDVTGACILIHHKVIEKGVEYGPNPIGEDIYFCSMARGFGYKIFVDGTIDTIHAMDFLPEELKKKEVTT